MSPTRATASPVQTAPPAVPPAVTVIVGSEELLADRAVSAVEKGAQRLDPDTDVRDVKVADVTAARIDEVLSPSLFGERRVLIIRGLGVGKAVDATGSDDSDAESSDEALVNALDADSLDRIVAHAATSDTDVHVVLVHREANRGRASLTTLRKAGAVFVECKKPAKGKTKDFVAAEFARHKRATAGDVPAAVVLATGHDLRALASTVSQICVDTSGEGPISRAQVEQHFAGRAEVDGFAIADALIEGRIPAALDLARHAMAVGASGPALTAAMAYSFRNLVKVSSAPKSGTLDEQARAVGVQEWQLRKLRQQLSGWTPDGVARAIRAIAEADADVKGAAVDAHYAIERVIVRIGRARQVR